MNSSAKSQLSIFPKASKALVSSITSLSSILPLLLLLLTTITIIGVREAEADPKEYELLESLMHEYDPLERPVENFTQAVKIKLGIILQQIIGVDEKHEVVEVNGWVQLTWKDYQLKWEPRDYNNIRDIRFNTSQIWKPDVLLYNSVDPQFDSTFQSNMIVTNDGTVHWRPPGILKISCKIDITWFPFDDQSCYLKFGSWTYHGFAVDLQPEDPENGMDISQYIESGEWRLLGTPVHRSIKYYDCCPEPYPDVKFYLNIRRRTLYYGFNLIIPSLLISVMTLLGFTMPPDACEKITLEITILLSVCFFLSIVGQMTPPTSEAVPLIGTFFTCCMIVVSASVVFTVVVLNLHFRTPDTHEMSPGVRTLLLNWLPWILMMQRPGHHFTRDNIMAAVPKDSKRKATGEGGSNGGGTNYHNQKKSGSESLMRNVRDQEKSTALGGEAASVIGVGAAAHLADSLSKLSVPFASKHYANQQKNLRDSDVDINDVIKPLIARQSGMDPGVNALMLIMQSVLYKMKYITKRMEDEDKYMEAENDWKFAAMVVDRLCLVIFTAFIIASTCGIMFSAPHLTA